MDITEFHDKLGVSTETSSAYNHRSVGSVKQMVQTVKQIMIKNPQNAWLAMLIFKATQIPDIHKSPAELLNSRKYCINLPMIDLNIKMYEPELESLVDKYQNVTSTGKELPKLDVGTKCNITAMSNDPTFPCLVFTFKHYFKELEITILSVNNKQTPSTCS